MSIIADKMIKKMGLFKSKTILEIGSRFGEKYDIIRLIGKGGMGEVYEANEGEGGRQVAVKVISSGTAEDDDLLRRFQLEGKALSLVNHPNIVSVYETGHSEGINYISMEYVEGQTLHQISKNIVIPDNELCMLFLQMCEGIRVLHQKNIIHRDIKPKNIIYQNENFIKILDFGIAKFQGDFTMHQTAIGVIVGTLLYMAPEVAGGGQASNQSDIWSLGSIFYEMLTGTPLIQAKMTFEALDQLKNLKVEFREDEGVVVSPEMQEIISRMCAKDPEERYKDLDQVIKDLQKFHRRYPATERWMYQEMCKPVANLDEVKKRLKKDGWNATQTKRILAEAVFSSGAKVQQEEVEKTMVLNSQSSESIEIEEEVLQEAIFRVTGQKPASSSMVNQDISQAKTQFDSMAQTSMTSIGESLREFADSVRKVESSAEATEVFDPSKWQQPQGDPHQAPPVPVESSSFPWFSDRQEWLLLVGAVIVLAVTAYHRMESKSTDRQPTSLEDSVPTRDLKVPDRKDPLSSWRQEDKATHQDWFSRKSTEKTLKKQPEVNQRVKEPVNSQKLPTKTSPKKVSSNKSRIETSPRMVPMKKISTKNPSTMVKLPVVLGREGPFIVNENMNFTFESRSISSAGDYSRFPVLRWKPMKNTANYLVQISANVGFQTLMVESLVDGFSFQWKDALPGNFVWRVLAIDKKGEKSRFSSTGQLTVNLPAPILQERIEKVFNFRRADDWKNKKSPLSFRWQEVPRARGYYVQLSRSPDFDIVLADWHLGGEQLNMETAGQGVFYFRVAAIDEHKKLASAFSNALQFIVERVFDVELPQLKSPRNDDRILIPAGDPNFIVVFSWSHLAGAKRYILQVARDKDFTDILLARSSKENRYTLGKELSEEGRFYWRVRPQSLKNGEVWSDVGTFSVQK